MYKKIGFLYLLLSSWMGLCQTPFQFKFNHLTREMGLTNNNVFYMYKDSRGFLWLATTSGLNRFDGISVRTYKPSNSTFKGNSVLNIVEDVAGNLWVGSEKGLNRYDRKSDTFSIVKSSKGNKAFSSYPFFVDKNDVLWLDIEDNQSRGLYCLDLKTNNYQFITSQTPIHISANQCFPTHEVTALFTETPNGIGFQKISFQNYKVKKIETFFDGKTSLPTFHNVGKNLFVENDSSVWVSNVNYGLVRFNPLTNTYQSFKQVYENKYVLFLGIAKYKHYFIVGSNSGVYFFDTKKKKFIQSIQQADSNPDGLMSNWNEFLYLDSEENFFISALGNGIDFTNMSRTFTDHWLKKEEVIQAGYPDNHINNIVQNRDFTFAKFHNAGTVLLDKNGKMLKRLEAFNPIFTDSNNRTWLFDTKKFRLIDPTNKTQKEIIIKELIGQESWQVSMTETAKGIFLFGSTAGIHQYNEATQQVVPILDYNKEKNFNTRPIYYDKKSNQVFVSASWWTTPYVLSPLNGSWHIKKKLNLPFSVFAIKPAIQAQKIWLCTSVGLALFDTKTFKYTLITEKEGLPDNSVTDIIEEPNSNYWLVTNRGIAYFDKQKNSYRNFTSKDGAFSNEYNWGCGFKLSDGRAVFGGNKGITVINLADLKRYSVKPKVQLTQLLVNEKPLETNEYIGETKTIELSGNQNSLALDMVAIEYGFPQKTLIEYRLMGADNQWVKAKNPSTARYANLMDGTYRFLVKATDEDGKNSSEIKELTIIIHAPFYRTIWFRTLMVLCFIMLGYAFYRLRISQIKQETKKKEEIRRIRAEAEINALRSQMNPHFIFNCLNTIDSYILTNKTDEASEFLNKFSKLIRMILENSRQELIPLNQELKLVELYIKLEQERSFPKFEYRIEVADELLKTEYFVPSMLMQPFIENAILHGLRHKKDGVGQLSISLSKQADSLLIHIIDNGVGRAASQLINTQKRLNKTSVGMDLTQERINKLNEIYTQKAFFNIKDIEENGRGTSVELSLPLLTE